MMERLITNIRKVYFHKTYMILLTLTAICSYGFKIVHPAMGIDDTPYAYYFEEGLAAVVGRWVLFVLNKFLSLSEFVPFLTDFAAVVLLMIAVTVWGGVFVSVLGDKVPRYGYWFFSCIFLSCPLIAEVFTYFLHNGIALGYLAVGFSLYGFREFLIVYQEGTWKKNLRKAIFSVLMLTFALGCYESFMIVWLTGVLMILWAECIMGNRKILGILCVTAIAAGVSVVLRVVIIKSVIAIWGLSNLQGEAVQRSMVELLGWILEPGAWAEFAMILKRLFVMYGVFGYAYYPIRIFVYAVIVLFVYSIWKSISQRNGRILAVLIMCFIAAFLLAVVEGKATLYRSAQFLPLFCGFGFLVASCAVSELTGKLDRKPRLAGGLQGIFVIVAIVFLWNQCADLNHWFYVDYMKYECAKEYLLRVAYELEADYDISKPISFTGEWENPRGIVESAYVAYNSETFYRMKRITDPIDEHLLEKFYRGYGVWVAQTPSLSVISWGKNAFGSDEQIIAFLRFHGHDFLPLINQTLYQEAENYAVDLPCFPQEGSIVDRGDYILVHF